MGDPQVSSAARFERLPAAGVLRRGSSPSTWVRCQGVWHRLWPRGLCGLVLFLLRSQFTLQELLCLEHQNGLFFCKVMLCSRVLTKISFCSKSRKELFHFKMTSIA